MPISNVFGAVRYPLDGRARVMPVESHPHRGPVRCCGWVARLCALLRWGALSGAMSALVACGGGGSGPAANSSATETSATQTIGPAGGTVSLNGKAILEVAPGTMLAPGDVTVSYAPKSDPLALAVNDVLIQIPADKLSASADAGLTVLLYPDTPQAASAFAGRAHAMGLAPNLDLTRYTARARVLADAAAQGVDQVVQWDISLGQRIAAGAFATELRLYRLSSALAQQARVTVAFNVYERNLINTTALHRWSGAAPDAQAALADPKVPDGKVPLILVHGIDVLPIGACGLNQQYADTWNKFKTYFDQTGSSDLTAKYDLFTFQYPTNLPIKDNGRRLAEELFRVFGSRPVVVVAHSMGGLVTRSADLYFSTSSQFHEAAAVDIDIRNVITLDTPHRGTPIADNLATLVEAACLGSASDQGGKDLAWEWKADGSCANSFLCDLNASDHLGHLKKYIPYAATFNVALASDSGVVEGILQATLKLASFTQLLELDSSCWGHTLYCRLRFYQEIGQLVGGGPRDGDGVTLVVSQLMQGHSGADWTLVSDRFLTIHPVFQGLDHSGIHDDVVVFNDWIHPDLVSFYLSITGQVAPAPSASLTASRGFTCGVTNLGLTNAAGLNEGGAKCWGFGGSGALGNGSNQSSFTPAVVVGLSTGVTAMAAGTSHACAIAGAGAVKCWGIGQLGDGTGQSRLAPVDVIGLSRGATAIAAGFDHSCAVTGTGGVKCWGGNPHGELGDGTQGVNRLAPVDVVGLSSGASAVSAGAFFTCALSSAGGVKCWGANDSGQLGDGTSIERLTPVEVLGLSSGVIAISAGAAHVCALTAAGGVKCWGSDSQGQLGNAAFSNSRSPVDVVGLSSGVTALSAGVGHSCAVISANTVKCWGAGPLGDGSRATHETPAEVPGLTGIAAVAAGEYHTCVATRAGAVSCWGANSGGQLGDGTTTDHLTPQAAPGF